MTFLTRITNGNCSECLSNLGVDGVAHKNVGEQHPIHRKCLELWLEAQRQRDQNPSCPSCHINVTSIETKQDSFIRLCQEGDLASVIALLKDCSLIKKYDSAVLKASEAGQHRIVEELLKNGSISNLFRGLALEAAAKNGNGELVDILFFANIRQRENIPTDSLEKSLNIARAQGHQNIVEKLEPLVQIRNIYGQVGDIRSEITLSLPFHSLSGGTINIWQ